MNSGSAPTQPDPWTTANTQQGFNTAAALQQFALNNVNQVTPYGSLSYTQTGTKNGVPTYTATTKLSPGMQSLVTGNIGNAGSASGIAADLYKSAADRMSKPLDLSPGATTDYLYKLARAQVDPQVAQDEATLNQKLANQGLTPGSEGWKYQQGQFGLNKAQTYNDLLLQGNNDAIAALTAEYNSPFNALASLQGLSQVSQPGIGTLAPTASASIAAPNYAQGVQNNYDSSLAAYNAQLASNNALMGGLFGLGGSALTGGANIFANRR